MAEKGISPSELQARITFMSLFNDIEPWKNQNESKCVHSAAEVASSAREFAQGLWSLRGLGDEDKWYGTVHTVVDEDEFGSEPVKNLPHCVDVVQPSAEDASVCELNLSFDDVTTLVQHGTPDLAEATRDRGATHCRPEFKSLGEVSRESGFPMTVSVGHRPCFWEIGVSRQSAESTQVQETQRKQANWDTLALDVQVIWKVLYHDQDQSLADGISCLGGCNWPRIGQIRDTTFGRKHKLNEQVHHFTDGACKFRPRVTGGDKRVEYSLIQSTTYKTGRALRRSSKDASATYCRQSELC